MLTAQQVIERLRLQPHPIEGGYFRETYRSELAVARDALASNYDGDRNVSTAIYYLLTPGSFSEMHRVKSDELFHFYAGDTVEMLQLFPNGSSDVVLIGNDFADGCEPQIVVPAGVWQGCHLVAGGQWALMGCTVAPGFEYVDYESGRRAELLREYPVHASLITALTVG